MRTFQTRPGILFECIVNHNIVVALFAKSAAVANELP